MRTFIIQRGLRTSAEPQQDRQQSLGRVLLAAGAVTFTLLTAGEMALLNRAADPATAQVQCESIEDNAKRLTCYDARAHQTAADSFKTILPASLTGTR